MTARYSLADVAALIGEPTRAAMLLGLLDGRARTPEGIETVIRTARAAA